MTLRHWVREASTTLDIVITREVPAPGAAAPTQFDPLTGVPLSPPAAQTMSQTIPARRFDPPVRDEVEAGAGEYFGISDSRYLVRHDPSNPWAVNDTFTDETGTRRRVVGIRNAQQQAHIAGALLELIGRT